MKIYKEVNQIVLTLKCLIMTMNMRELKCNFKHYQISKLQNKNENQLKRRRSSKFSRKVKRLKGWVLNLMNKKEHKLNKKNKYLILKKVPHDFRPKVLLSLEQLWLISSGAKRELINNPNSRLITFIIISSNGIKITITGYYLC